MPTGEGVVVGQGEHFRKCTFSVQCTVTDLFPQKTPDEFCSASVSRASVRSGPFSELYLAFPRDSFLLSNFILCMGVLFAFMSVHHVHGRLRRSEDPGFPGIGVTGWL